MGARDAAALHDGAFALPGGPASAAPRHVGGVRHWVEADKRAIDGYSQRRNDPAVNPYLHGAGKRP